MLPNFRSAPIARPPFLARMLAVLACVCRPRRSPNPSFSPLFRSTRPAADVAGLLAALLAIVTAPSSVLAHPGHPGHAQADHRHGDDFPDSDSYASLRKAESSADQNDEPTSVWLYRPGRREAVAAVIFFAVAIYSRRSRDTRQSKWLRFSGSFRMAVVTPEPLQPGVATSDAPRRRSHRVRYFEMSTSSDPPALSSHGSPLAEGSRQTTGSVDEVSPGPAIPRVRYLLAAVVSIVALLTIWPIVRRPDGIDREALAVDRLASIGVCGFVGAATLAASVSGWLIGRRRRSKRPASSQSQLDDAMPLIEEAAADHHGARLPKNAGFPDSMPVALAVLLAFCGCILEVELCGARLPSTQASNLLGLVGLGALAGLGLTPWVLARQRHDARSAASVAKTEHTLIAADGREVDSDEPAFSSPIDWTSVLANHLLLAAGVAGFAAALAADHNSALVAAATLLLFGSVSAAESRYAARRRLASP